MNLYEKCVSLMNNSNATLLNDNDSLSISTNNTSVHITTPIFINSDSTTLRQKSVYYISDLHLVNHILDKFPKNVSDKTIDKYIHNIVLQLFEGELGNNIRSFKTPIVLFGGDISSVFSIAEIFYQDFVSTWEQIAKEAFNIYEQKDSSNDDDLDFNKSCYEHTLKHPYIYTILGNHELWDFDSYDACKSAYEELFKKLGIIFLNDKIYPLGSYQRLNNDDFDIYKYNVLIAGSLGFAAMNPTFNADQFIYQTALSHNEEIIRCEKWRELFYEATRIAKNHHCALVVLTHTPICDWIEKTDKINNCYIFSGHTHRNEAYACENNTYIFADNQVGYKSNKFQFKKVLLHIPRNPFASDPDGYRETNCEEYKEYYRYVGEVLPRTGKIELQISKFQAKLYVIKKENYVGFFLVSPKGVYICNGGQIRKIGHTESLERYAENFIYVVNKYITALSPLRKAQEQLSAYIKSFGGSGKIHGTIVDIDSFNHVMFNTTDGTLTYYYSPTLGLIKTYPDIGTLVHAQCPELEDSYTKVGELKLITKKEKFNLTSNNYEIVDLKNSQYSISRRVNALQRLFDKHILRDWNSEIENKQITE